MSRVQIPSAAPAYVSLIPRFGEPAHGGQCSSEKSHAGSPTGHQASRTAMPHQHNTVLSYREHKATGQAVVTLDGRDHYLGKHGTPEGHAQYQRLIEKYVDRDSRMSAPGGRRRLPRGSPLRALQRVRKARISPPGRLAHGHRRQHAPCDVGAVRVRRRPSGGRVRPAAPEPAAGKVDRAEPRAQRSTIA